MGWDHPQVHCGSLFINFVYASLVRTFYPPHSKNAVRFFNGNPALKELNVGMKRFFN